MIYHYDYSSDLKQNFSIQCSFKGYHLLIFI